MVPLASTPLISVITIVYNGEHCLEKTIKSVLAQKFTDYEYIIIDGGSTDNTLNIIKKYDSQLGKWVCEPDKGISDAFNKGISLASGRYLNLLNAGDTFLDDNVLGRVSENLRAPIVNFRHQMEGHLVSGKVDINAPIKKRCLLGHQATFVSKDIYKRYGGYGLSFKIRMDYDFFLRVLPHERLAFIDDVIVNYDAGISGSLSNVWRYETEGLVAEYLNLKKSGFYLLSIFYKPALNIIRRLLTRTTFYRRCAPFVKKLTARLATE